jgi:hypothetical protein
MVTWSYSSIKTFDQCPKKYYHLKVAKDVKDEAGPAADYGTEAHTAAEEFIKNGTPIPDKFKFMAPTIETLAKLKGTKHAEMKLGIRKTDEGFEPCGFFDKGVWWRGIADLIIINGHKAFVVDYKTGKNAKYADVKQLDLLAAAVFLHYPQVQTIKSALLFVVSNELIKKDHVITERSAYLSVFNTQLDRLEAAEQSGVWNPISGPLCGWCPVTECPHHRKRR